MRTPKGMIRALLTPEELEQLISLYTSQIGELGEAMETTQITVRYALLQTKRKFEERIAELKTINCTPKKIGRSRKEIKDGPNNNRLPSQNSKGMLVNAETASNIDK